MKPLLALLLCLFASSGLACECVHNEFDTSAASQAKVVLLFRVVSSKLEPDGHGVAIAEIEVVRSFRGESAETPRIRYYTGWCCGTHVDVGHYYLVFAAAPAPVIDIDLGNLLSLFDFSPENTEWVAKAIKPLLSGEAIPPQDLVKFSLMHLTWLKYKPEMRERLGADTPPPRRPLIVPRKFPTKNEPATTEPEPERVELDER